MCSGALSFAEIMEKYSPKEKQQIGRSEITAELDPGASNASISSGLTGGLSSGLTSGVRVHPVDFTEADKIAEDYRALQPTIQQKISPLSSSAPTTRSPGIEDNHIYASPIECGETRLEVKPEGADLGDTDDKEQAN